MSDNNIENENVEQPLTKRVRCDYTLLEQDIMKLRKQNVLKEYFNKILKPLMKDNGIKNPTGPKKRTPDENGYYLSTSGKEENRTRVRTCDEIYALRKWGLDKTHHYTFHPCYKNIHDKSTLEFCLIYYGKEEK